MTVQVQHFARMAPQARVEIVEPSASPKMPLGARLRPVGKRIWHLLVVAFSGPDLGEDYRTIDDTAFPAGYNVPYRRGSRAVRNLWHQPF